MEKQTNKQKNPPFLCEGTEEVSWPTRIPPTSQGCSALTGVRLRPPGSFRPAGSRHTHHEEERQDVLQPEPARVEALHLHPDHQRVPGAQGQELGFDLDLLPSLLRVPGCTLFIHNVGHASDSERRWCQNIVTRFPVQDLRVFQNQCQCWIFHSACLIQNPIKGTWLTLRKF